MPFRLWIGLWTALLLIIMVAFDLNYLIRYITRYSEECFSCLISLIFIVSAFQQLSSISHEYPVAKDIQKDILNVAWPECYCVKGPKSSEIQEIISLPLANVTSDTFCQKYGSLVNLSYPVLYRSGLFYHNCNFSFIIIIKTIFQKYQNDIITSTYITNLYFSKF